MGVVLFIYGNNPAFGPRPPAEPKVARRRVIRALPMTMPLESAKVNKPAFIAGLILAVLIAVAAGFWYWKKAAGTPEEKAAESAEKAVESATQGTLPEINPLSNPLDKIPEVNPVEKANPFKDIYKNPFR